jgi:hypothetical protein
LTGEDPNWKMPKIVALPATARNRTLGKCLDIYEQTTKHAFS